MTRAEKQRELQWQAEDDARTMARYQEIMNDKNRMSRAVKVAKKQADDLQKRTNIMKKVAKTTKKDDNKKKR